MSTNISMYNLTALRNDEFPFAQTTTYLNHASISPIPKRSIEKGQQLLADLNGSASTYYSETLLVLQHRYLQHIATYVNAPSPTDVIFVPSTSAGLNLAAQSVDWQPDDEIIFCDVEFPSNAFPWLALEREGVRCVIVPAQNGTLTLSALEKAVTPKTRLVAVSAVQFFTGGRANLEAIGAFCHEHSIIFAVDAIQAIGHMPIDVQAMNIDILCSGGQKSMMASPGTGFLYIRNAIAEQMLSRSIGPNATVDWEHWLDYDISPAPGAQRLMMGTLNFVGMITALTSLEMFDALGRHAVHQHTHSLAHKAIEQLIALGYNVITPIKQHGPIVTFAYAEQHETTDQLIAKLKANNVIVTKHQDRVGNPYVRISIHCYNVEKDITNFLNYL